jgi:hypothetical protein
VIFEDVMAFAARSRRKHFVTDADFHGRHITAEVVKTLRNMDPSWAVRKLIRASRFDITLDFGDCPEGALFAAVSASLSGDHERARLAFSGVSNQSLFALIDPTVLATISADLKPEVLVVIGHPELPNGEWTVDERIAARRFLEGNVGKCPALAAGKMETWHFEEWPKRLRMVNWMDGEPMMEFATGLVVGRETIDRDSGRSDSVSQSGQRWADDHQAERNLSDLVRRVTTEMFLEPVIPFITTSPLAP